jgi:hypothetical protein
MTKEERHYRNVAALPCACCGIHGYSQAAHSNRSTDGKGGMLKADWRKVFPLCCTRVGEVGCHVRHDQFIGITRAEASRRTDVYLVMTETTLRGLGQWPEYVGPQVMVAKPLKKVIRTPEQRAAREAARQKEKSRAPVRAGRGLPSMTVGYSNVGTQSKTAGRSASQGQTTSKRIVSGPPDKENARSRFPKGRKLVSANRLQSRPFGAK